ncbi:tail fiber protein [Pseudomonas phage JOR]|nr:tail fiber protein [Pseudomonas phage JOR]
MFQPQGDSMATTPKTVRTFTLDGAKKDFTIPFEYLARKFVVVTLIGATRRELILNTEYRFSTATTITTTKAWGPADNFDLIEIRRLTSATERLVDFADGSILRAYDLNISQVQSLHIAEEARDLTADTIGVNNDGDLDARARKIVNLADGVNDGDAVNLRQQKQWAGSALNQANAAAASAQQAATNNQQSLVNNQQSYQNLVAAQQQAANSQTSANNSANSASASQTSRLASETARDLSQAWASKAEDQVVSGSLYSSYHYSRKSAASATASQTSANNSANSASFSTTEANRATSQADRAKTEADKLGNANAFMGSIDSVGSNTVRFKDNWTVRTTTLWADNIYGNSVDKINIKAGTVGFDGVTNMAGKLTITSGGLTVTGAATLNSGLTVTGGGINATGDVYASGLLRAKGGTVGVWATSASANCHFWFYDNAGASRGVVYADQSGNVRVQAGSSLTATFNADGSSVFNGLTAGSFNSNRSGGQSYFYSPYAQLDGAMYGTACLQLQGTGGGVANLGFHNAGRVAGALWLNNDNMLWWMQNNGVNHQMTTSYNCVSHVAGMTSDIVGCIATMQNVSGANQGQNAVLGGGSLRYSTHNNPSGIAGSGSWRNLGWSNNGGVSNWIRYA